MNTSFIQIILMVFVLSNLFAGLNFLHKQQGGSSFIDSFDQSVARGGIFFALGSGLAMIVLIAGNFTQHFI